MIMMMMVVTMVSSYIKDVLENIDRGDIQTAVTIIIMLNDYVYNIYQRKK